LSAMLADLTPATQLTIGVDIAAAGASFDISF
jgi:hypothetical protein